MKRIDMHVHIVGNGLCGSGCWLRPSGWYSLLGRFMIQHIGLRVNGFDDPSFDDQYVNHLVQLVRLSSIYKAIILANDQVYHDSGELMKNAGTFYVPNDYVLKLAKKYPNEFLPAVSIHPARADAIQELERCAEQGAVMMKCLPNCHNIDCGNRKYRKFWERMAELGLPLLAHTGGEHTLQIIRPEYANPRILMQPLECGVTCIAAHCGGRGFLDPDYFHIFEKMIHQFSKLYGDISAFNIPLRSKHFHACLQEPLVNRLLHGSDFPVPVFGYWAWMRGLMDTRDLRAYQKEKNVIERDFRFKQVIGFEEPVFSRIGELIPGGIT